MSGNAEASKAARFPAGRAPPAFPSLHVHVHQDTHPETSVMPPTLPSPTTSLPSLCPLQLSFLHGPGCSHFSACAQTLAHFPPEIWSHSSALVSLPPPQRIFLKHITLQTKTHRCPSLPLESDPSFRAGQDEVAYPSMSANYIPSALHKQLCEVNAILHPHFKSEKPEVQRGSDGWHSK